MGLKLRRFGARLGALVCAALALRNVVCAGGGRRGSVVTGWCLWPS